jgi:hypothetical protein
MNSLLPERKYKYFPFVRCRVTLDSLYHSLLGTLAIIVDPTTYTFRMTLESITAIPFANKWRHLVAKC